MAGRMRWNRVVKWIIGIVLVGELISMLALDRLDGMFFTSPIRSLTSRRYQQSNSRFPGDELTTTVSGDGESHSIRVSVRQSSCAAWLEEADKLPPGRNFTTDPILVIYANVENWPSCSVGCAFRLTSDQTPDGAFRKAMTSPPYRTDGTSHILRSMESATYYPENNLATAHASGFDVVMTTNLASDVPVGYFSWAEYDIMGPVERKGPDLIAAAFISNCAAHNFRLEALDELRRFRVSVDSFGKCRRTREAGSKLETIKHYKFSLAFENSNEEDYVTEKFWQSLVAGSVPVVVGAPNIADFAPAPKSFLHIKSLDDVSRVASQMRYLSSNNTAYNETLRWKYEGPSNAFKALVDMAAVHSSCRLCIHIATIIRMEEESDNADAVAKRPCQCTDVDGTVTYHLFVRERGRFEYVSIFLSGSDLSLVGLEAAVLAKFRSMSHVTVWFTERPQKIRGDGSFDVYRIYPVGLTQRDALYSVYFQTDDNVKGHLDDNPCAKLEVIFV